MQLRSAKNMEMPQQKRQVLSLSASKIKAMGCRQPEGEDRILKKPVQRVLACGLLVILATKWLQCKHLQKSGTGFSSDYPNFEMQGETPLQVREANKSNRALACWRLGLRFCCSGKTQGRTKTGAALLLLFSKGIGLIRNHVSSTHIFHSGSMNSY